jgi:FKBP-type peptidyl-prolyl cis-trans isomerase
LLRTNPHKKSLFFFCFYFFFFFLFFFPLGKATFVIPSDLAYGDTGSGPVIPPGATLKFEVELFKVLDLDADADELQGGETEVIELPDGTKMRVPKGVKMRLVDEEE